MGCPETQCTLLFLYSPLAFSNKKVLVLLQVKLENPAIAEPLGDP
jgi:hypothetical protein